MPAITYREHLALFNKYKVATIPYGKILGALAFTLIISAGISLAYSNTKNKQIAPVNEQSTYFQSVSGSYYKSKQALDDLRSNLQVAGVKTQTIDTLREASASSRVPGFFTTIGDIQKTIDQIKVARENIANEKKNVQSLQAPQLYNVLSSQLVEYQTQSEDFLTSMEKSQLALKDLITAAGPAFYLPTLSDENIWQQADVEAIKNYYSKRKEEAQEAQNNFNKVATRDDLKNYKSLQISQMMLVVNVSDNITAVLSRPIPEEEEEKSKLLEEAYQVLVGAQRENEEMAEKLAQMRTDLSSLANYSSVLASLSNRERIIESGLVQTQPKPVADSQISN